MYKNNKNKSSNNDISTIETLPGMSGMSKNPEDQTKDYFGRLGCLKPKLNRIGKTLQKQGFFVNFCSIMMVFHGFFHFG